MKFLRLIAFAAIIFSQGTEAVAAPGIADIAIIKDSGFVDLDLTMTDAKASFSTALTAHAAGMIDGELAGFAIDILPTWKQQSNGNRVYSTSWGGIRLRSLGKESDRFLALLARLYGIQANDFPMAQKIEFQAVSLQGDPALPDNGPVKMKLFFEGKTEAAYAEVYVNIDLKKGRLEFHEKDPGYRDALIDALRQGS
ncbi:hypothetical protein BCF11_3616 [Collimonas sp. PA-H2]|uniref:hypothetical protein n=1 Tax=Collimonas sp. PA-H2 TaxID=1881062 RepID=UPI000BF2900A|nr:hypothetical protein [Collimonas sp. PA-H2]PFH11174.1 hypothetical protein BCF11_3616 [Collimonas sp. PA-H2]